MALKRILKEIKEMKESQPLNISLIPINENDYFNFKGIIIGPDYSPYENGIYYLSIKIPTDYPSKPPKCKFLTKIFHPNIHSNGSISLDILEDQWSPALTIPNVLLSISSLLSEPNFYNVLCPEVWKLYNANKYEYYKKAREFAEKYADAPPNHKFYYFEFKERIDYELNHIAEIQKRYSQMNLNYEQSLIYKEISIYKINDLKWKAQVGEEQFEIEFPYNYPYSPPNFTLISQKKDKEKEEKIKTIVKSEWNTKILINDILEYIHNYLKIIKRKKELGIYSYKISENEYLTKKEKTEDVKVITLINLLLKEKCQNTILKEQNENLEKKLEEYSKSKSQINQEIKKDNQKINSLVLINNNNSSSQNNVLESILESQIKYLSLNDLYIIINSQIGLINLGNTCYINSSIQPLIHCSIFMEKLLNNIKFTSKKTQFTNNFLYICYKMKNANQAVNISEFKYLIDKKYEIFKGARQNDSQEFLRKLLENISMELNGVEKVPWQDLSNSFSKPKLLRFNVFKKYSREREKSIITDLFYSIISTTLTCECNYECYPFQELLDIPLLIPKNNNNSININQILEKFFNIQYVVKFCKRCNKETRHKQNIKIGSPPEILILSLQRFNEIQIKNESLVEFDEIIDLSTFIDNDCGYQDETIYNLFGVINHYGNLEFGHYNCFIKLFNNDWYEFNDNSVNKINFKDFKKKNICTLFYTKLNLYY